MSFEYIIEKDNKVKKLSDIDCDLLAGKITDNFKEWNNARRVNLDQADTLMNEIFFKNAQAANKKPFGSFTDEPKKKAWKSDIHLGKTFMFYQTLKAFIWKNTYSNPSSMFDVSGENQEADNDSTKQKAMLVDKFEKMQYPLTCDKVIDYALIYGELITFCGWKKQTEEYRKLIGQEDMENPAALRALEQGKYHFVDERLIFDNPYIYSVNPANFVFDVAQKENWDSCPKIYKTFKTPDEIINNKYYTVSKEVAEYVKSAAKTTTANDTQDRENLENKSVNGSTVEVLEHWGNITLPNGATLKNYHVVVVDGKYIVRFCKNSRIVNPFTYASWVEDNVTKRGISPLYSVLNLAHLQENLMNRTVDMQTLSENPPVFAPRGLFKEDYLDIDVGKIIEYGDAISPSEIKPMEFNVGIFLNDISFLSDMMSEVSGIFPNMAGADEQKAKTATEISTKAQGQMTRLSMLVDIINQGMIVPDVKKVAKLCADFKSGIEKILINKGNEKETIEIDDSVRQQEYRYTYSDRTAMAEKLGKTDKVVQGVREFANFIPLNGQELFTWYMEQNDVENPERFLPAQQQIPPEAQQILLQDPNVQALCQQVELAKQGQMPQQNQLPPPEPQQQLPMQPQVEQV